MPHADAKFSFPENKRLKSSQRIRFIVAQRKSIAKYPIKCFYQTDFCQTSGGNIRVAMLVSKRKFRHAVDRNRVKRLFRGAFRLNYNILTIPNNLNLDICWMFVGQELPEFSTVSKVSIELFKTLQTIINQNISHEKNN